jgi:diguanylate cyclase (GGDEF)-like protein/PAS domain S-box-containing protein
MPAEQRAAVDNLLRHGDTIVLRVGEITTLMHEVAELGSGDQLDALTRSYASGHDRAQARAGRFQTALFAVAILLTAFLAGLFGRLEVTRRSLARANREITERYQAQLLAEKQLLLHATAFRSGHDGITLTDAQGNIVDVNPAFTRITGWERDEVLGLNPRVLQSGKHDPAFYSAMWKSITESGSWKGEIWNRNKSGDIYPELLSISAVRAHSGELTNYVAVFSDIGPIKKQESQLKKMAYFDALTELPNRVLLVDRLLLGMAQSRRSQTVMAVCYLDLDGFKAINDAWGHEYGDRVLIEMARRMGSVLRGGDTLARLGGDEFVVLLMGLNDAQECREAVSRLLHQIAMPLALISDAPSLSASVGVALFPQDDENPDILLRHADQAMYRSKQSGKNMLSIFDPEEDRSNRNRHDRAARVRQALEGGELRLYYQPKVDMRRGCVTGMEALLRWQHPERGILGPLEFLPLVENDDLIIDIGDWVIQTALEQLLQWDADGLDLQVSVNVAARQLQSADFSAKLKKMHAAFPHCLHRLELEILETAALEDIVKTARIIEECRVLGVGFALDDFGTGYSSLTYLRRLPVRTLKIDQSFVREILNDPSNLLIVQAVIGLADAFQLQVIAEGVESVAHGQRLLQLRCHHAQGYGISRPMPAALVADWVRQWKPDPAWSASLP